MSEKADLIRRLSQLPEEVERDDKARFPLVPHSSQHVGNILPSNIIYCYARETALSSSIGFLSLRDDLRIGWLWS